MKENKTSPLSHLSILGYHKQKLPEQEILDGVKKYDNEMFRYIYKSYFPGIRSMVAGFRSLALDPEDIFQEGLIAASRNVVEGKFKGDSSFNTYLSAVCRNICRKQLQLQARYDFNTQNQDVADETESSTEALISRLTSIKEKMDDKCREIIDMRFGLDIDHNELINKPESISNVRFEEIASKLSIEATAARKRFQRCLEKLKETVFSDGLWNDLLANG